MNEIPIRYNPEEAEDKWYKLWEEKNLFVAKKNPAKKPFSIVIPPPNVTGILHMGHALNNTIQDILIRYHRMKGQESLWMPGTDHAGIATQNVVEKSIAKEGLKRQDLGREKFIERVWQWKEQYGSTIIHQLTKLGASCDWNRSRFTMDEQYSEAVIEVFVRLYEKGLIYQGSYIINWCPRCQTALSDEEAPHRELQGNLYYLRYPLKDVSRLASERVSGLTSERVNGLKNLTGEPANRLTGTPKSANRQTGKQANYIVVATTRPETMLGDTAVAVNPRDKRYKNFIGKTLLLPLINREIKVIADSMVDMKFGTGAVKVTPAHDPNDYVLGKKHRLEFVNVIYPDGRMNKNAGDYQGMDRFEAREVIIEDLKEKGLLEKIEPHKLSAGHCYRCHTIIEPYLSKQWFVKMKPLAKPAIDVVKTGKIKFYPKRWTKVYLNWMENIQDWCISRQIWWGHRLPVYYCKTCQKQANELPATSCQSPVASRQSTKTGDWGPGTGDNNATIVSRVKPDKCPSCGSSDIYQDEDVLDTWFSSWLWPFATFYWPFLTQINANHPPQADQPTAETQIPADKTSATICVQSANICVQKDDLNYFYPTSVLVTAPEIIFFWVARMIMAGMEFMHDIPFHDVYIHGTVRDIEGKKMSKSLGNIIDPLEIISEYGADALRFSLISITAQGQDVFLSKERFEQGRNFANKIWNASRFIIMNLQTRLTRTDLCVFFKKEDLSLINRWVLSRFYSTLKELNKYLDSYKFNEAANLLYRFFWHEFCDWYLELIKQDIKNPHNQVVMYKILEKFLRAIHPFMPFISEEIWQKINPAEESIMIQPWPHIQENIIDKKTETKMKNVFEAIAAIRNMRSEMDIPVWLSIKTIISTNNKIKRGLITSLSSQIKNLCRLSELVIEEKYIQLKSTITTVIGDMHISIPLEGILDKELEKAKLDEKIKKIEQETRIKEDTLKNKNFIHKAPVEIVEKEKEKLKELKDILNKLKAVKNGL